MRILPPANILLRGLLALTVALGSLAGAAERGKDAAPEWEDAVPRPALCPVFIDPPARVLPAWRDAAAREQIGRVAPVAVQLDPAWDDEWAGSNTTPHSNEQPPKPRHAVPNETIPPPAPADTQPVIMEADKADLQRTGVSRLEGNVWLQQGERYLSTDALEFEETSGVIRTLAPAQFGTRALIVESERAVYNMNIGEGLFEGVDFQLPQRYARGSADLLARTGPQTAKLEGVKYSTCPPDDEDWWLKASSMDIDQESGRGVGRNVRIAFMGVPFFYIPWISFPIDERRQTGFLFPEFGDSGRNGVWLHVPYYLNLAPNYDATLAAHYMADRGTRLDGQFRYLFPYGQGVAEAEYLDEDSQTGESRYYYRLNHLSPLPAGWRFSALYQQVSDEEYVQDFSDSGNATLVSHLPQTFAFAKNEREYGATIRYLRYQTVDPTIPEADRPYEAWPGIDYYYAPWAFWDRLWFQFDGESVNFQRDDRLEGWRHHLTPSFSTDLGSPALRLTPRLAWWHTEYDLVDTNNAALQLERSLPVASLDASSRFARTLQSGGSQTLEPRLFYLYIPYRDQGAIPRFDTRNGSDGLGSLFRTNRFTGPDRVGDENRVTLGLESKLIDAGGREWMSAALARAWYLEDRRVTLQADDTPLEDRVSDYYGRLKYLPSERQSLQFDLGWNPGDERVNFGAAQYQFRPADMTVLNLSYLYRRDRNEANPPLEQAAVSFSAPVAGRWQLFGKAIYSIEDERSQETLFGFEYESCCWVFRAVNRRYIFNREGEFDTALWFQLELKGLSSVGRRLDEFLADDIYGYGESE